MADSSDCGDDRTKKSPEPRATTLRPSEARIKAVADRLAEQKDRIDRPAKQATIDMGEVSRSIVDAFRRPAADPGPSPSVEGLSIPGDSTPVKLPADRRVAESGNKGSLLEAKNGQVQVEGSPQSHPNGLDPASRPVPASPLIEKQIALASSVHQSPPASFFRAQSNQLNPPIESIPQGRIEAGASTIRPSEHASSPFASVEPTRLRASIAPPATSPSPNSMEAAGGSAPARVGPVRHSNPMASMIPSKDTAISPGQNADRFPTPAGLGDHFEVQSVISGASHSGTLGDRSSAPSDSAGPSMGFVRNPMSSDMKGSSISSPAYNGHAGSASEQGGMGRGASDVGAGGSSSSQGGNSVDLSKTNELLQQLIDAVRKQRDSSLPAGGRSVYPER